MKCVDLFSGCGGLSLGFANAGIQVEASVDHWEKAVEIYRQNFTHPCHLHDLKDEDGCIEIIEKYAPDMIIGGPPCQDFSPAGKRDETLGRADLTHTFANIITRARPEWFVMENVERIRNSQILLDVARQFEDAGYGLSAVILDASFCGVPQTRKRFFMIGQLGGTHNQLNPIYMKNMAENPMTMRDYFGDSLKLKYYYRHPWSYARRGVFPISEPSPTVRGVNRPVPAGYKKHSGDPKDADLKKIRPLTTVERSYIQTFPKDFKFSGSKTHLEQMIGNAVPVNLATFVARGILEFIENKPAEAPKAKPSFEVPKTSLHRLRPKQRKA